MRLGTFLFGGICGAVALMVWNRKSKNLMLSSFFNAGNSVNKMANKAANAMGNGGATAAKNNQAGVQSTVNEDQKLKQTVNEILASGSSVNNDSSSITV